MYKRTLPCSSYQYSANTCNSEILSLRSNCKNKFILFNMKTLALCLLVVLLGAVKIQAANEIPHEIAHMVADVREKCHRETGVDIEHVDRTVEGYFHPTETLGCYFSCIFGHFDLLNHDGHIDFDKLIPKIPDSFKDHGMEMINACRHLTGKNPCDAAFNIVQCFQKTNPEKFFVI